jgi:hypothetical protein
MRSTPRTRRPAFRPSLLELEDRLLPGDTLGGLFLTALALVVLPEMMARFLA